GMGRAGRVPDTRELVISSTPFIAIYQVRMQVIFILRILHVARKWP
ncbi:MAG: toxin Y4kP, partial [Gammaproteobacteria bacterium]|nr:toxin Y4kP [Gammaproteobacteria bacterium]